MGCFHNTCAVLKPQAVDTRSRNVPTASSLLSIHTGKAAIEKIPEWQRLHADIEKTTLPRENQTQHKCSTYSIYTYYLHVQSIHIINHTYIRQYLYFFQNLYRYCARPLPERFYKVKSPFTLMPNKRFITIAILQLIAKSTSFRIYTIVSLAL